MPAHPSSPLAPPTLRLASGQPLTLELIDALLARHHLLTKPRLDLFWSYYRNQLQPSVTLNVKGGLISRGLRLAQERGLPARLVGAWDRRGLAAQLADDRSWSRKEVVIENDIAWRIHTMVDFMFGRPIAISSTARDPALRARINRVLDAVLEASGGIALLQDMGLYGHVYGSVDIIVRAEPKVHDTPPDESVLADACAAAVHLQLMDPAAVVPLASETPGTAPAAYIIRTERPLPELSTPPQSAGRSAGWKRLFRPWAQEPEQHLASDAPAQKTQSITEVFAGSERAVYGTDERQRPVLFERSPSRVVVRSGDQPPIVHIQNISQPGNYEGLSEVEPLIPLQDELNTRLSDRASRVTMQSFKMYLAKGMDITGAIPIGPGTIWSTENLEASIEAFGGDAASPSEDRHIDEVREAMDKASGVPPLASGVVRAKIGNLTSENALKITLMGLISKTSRKRITYGRGLAQLCTLTLDALDRAGLLPTDPRDRFVRIDWPDALPRDERQALDAAVRKIELGVPRERVLSELGYAPVDPGVT